MTTTEPTQFDTLPNPYVKDTHEGELVNTEVGALLRVASILEPHPHLQVNAVRAWVPTLCQGSREIRRALIWEICNQIRQHASIGITFPHRDQSDCDCGSDHTEAVEAYNSLIDNALAGTFQPVVNRYDSWMGAHVEEMIVQWLGVMSDHVAELRTS